MTEESKVVLITGGASSIGWATANEFASRGWRVTIGDIDLSAAQRRAAEHPGKILALALDVIDRKAVIGTDPKLIFLSLYIPAPVIIQPFIFYCTKRKTHFSGN